MVSIPAGGSHCSLSLCASCHPWLHRGAHTALSVPGFSEPDTLSGREGSPAAWRAVPRSRERRNLDGAATATTLPFLLPVSFFNRPLLLLKLSYFHMTLDRFPRPKTIAASVHER